MRPHFATVEALPRLQPHARPILQVRSDTTQEVIEEGSQAFPRTLLIVVRPLLAPVDLEPLLFRLDAPKALQRSSRMQTLIGPAGNDECRYLDGFQVRRLRRPEVIQQRMLRILGRQVLYFRRRVAPSAGQVWPEPGLWNAAMPSQLAIRIRPAFPRVDGGKTGWMFGSHKPLHHGQVGHA